MAIHPPPESDEALLAECDVDTGRARGKGGQHVNTTDSAVRLRHRPTGLVAIAQDARSQFLNKRLALRRLRQKLAVLAYEAPPRIPTRVPARARRKVRLLKLRQGQKKRLRGRVGADE